jgi:RNA polymerase sigma-70 factor (ECF subfamily)
VSEHSGKIEAVEPTGFVDEATEDADTDCLVEAFHAGDKEAFSVLYSRYFDRVYGYMRVAFESPYEAEDATQQVFTRVFEALPRYEARGKPFRVWLFVVVRNQAITQLKQLARLEPVDPAELDLSLEAAAPPQASEEAAAIFSLEWIADTDLLMFVERLPVLQRQVLAMRYMLDLSNKQIAVLLGRSPNEIAVLQRRALIFVRKRLHAIGRRLEIGGADDIQMKAFNPQSRVLRERRFSLKDR